MWWVLLVPWEWTPTLQHCPAEWWKSSMWCVRMLQRSSPGFALSYSLKTSFPNWFRHNCCPEVWAARGGAGRALPALARCAAFPDWPSPTPAWRTFHADLMQMWTLAPLPS